MFVSILVQNTCNKNKYYMPSTFYIVKLPLALGKTGQPRYVKLAYLEYMAYVEVIIHS